MDYGRRKDFCPIAGREKANLQIWKKLDDNYRWQGIAGALNYKIQEELDKTPNLETRQVKSKWRKIWGLYFKERYEWSNKEKNWCPKPATITATETGKDTDTLTN